jgi:hypothetical protein
MWDQTKVKLTRFHLWCKQRPAALDGVEAQSVPGFASLGATAKEAVRAWLQAPAEQWLRPEESERPWPMAITCVHPPPTDDSMDGSGATVRAIAAAATSAVPAPDVATMIMDHHGDDVADDHGDGASTWVPPPRQRKRKRDCHVDAKESSHRQWKAFGSDPTRRSMKGIRTVHILRIVHTTHLHAARDVPRRPPGRPCGFWRRCCASLFICARRWFKRASCYRATEQQRQ